MDRTQAKEFIKLMAASYQSFEPTPDRVRAWTYFLDEIDYDVALNRLKNHIRMSRFAPSIAEILNPEEVNRKAKRTEQEGDSPAAIMFGYEIYDPTKH